MGHDILGYKNDDKDMLEEIACLRRGASNPLNQDIYLALDAREYYAGWSGNGGRANFTDDQLKDALTKIPDGGSYNPEREFLTDCIEKGGGGAWIGFF